MGLLLEIEPAGVPVVVEVCDDGELLIRSDLMNEEEKGQIKDGLIAAKMGFEIPWVDIVGRLRKFPVRLLVMNEKMSQGQFALFVCHLIERMSVVYNLALLWEDRGWHMTFKKALELCTQSAQMVLDEEQRPLASLSQREAFDRLAPVLLEDYIDEEDLLDVIDTALSSGETEMLRAEKEEALWSSAYYAIEHITGNFSNTWVAEKLVDLFNPAMDAATKSFYDEDGSFDHEAVDRLVNRVEKNLLLTPGEEEGDPEITPKEVTGLAISVIEKTS